MNDTYDELYRIFEYHLLSEKIEHESEEDFVHDVVLSFCCHLKLRGYTFGLHSESVKSTLTEDVTDMLRTKIYGHFNINQFRQNLRSKKPQI